MGLGPWIGTRSKAFPPNPSTKQSQYRTAQDRQERRPHTSCKLNLKPQVLSTFQSNHHTPPAEWTHLYHGGAEVYFTYCRDWHSRIFQIPTSATPPCSHLASTSALLEPELKPLQPHSIPFHFHSKGPAPPFARPTPPVTSTVITIILPGKGFFRTSSI